jgi:uncharacterized phage protein (TIGR01671 family)
MREIKFRAWDKEKKIMAEWDFLKRFPAEQFNEWNGYMQFTGLHDKLGKEIFEDDIIQLLMMEEPGQDLSVINMRQFKFHIVFDKGAFVAKHGDHTYPTMDMSQVEVIGDIYQNPELLSQ